MRRNAVVSASAALVMLALTAGVVVSWAFAHQAANEAAAARIAEKSARTAEGEATTARGDAEREATVARKAEKDAREQKTRACGR